MSDLFDAIAQGDGKTVQRLLDSGADVNAFDAENRTPLMAAAQFGDEGIVLALLDAGADPTLRAKDDETAYLKAAAHGQAKVLALLARFASREERELAAAFVRAHDGQVVPFEEEGPSELRQTLVKATGRAAAAFGDEASGKRVDRLERAQTPKKPR